MIYIYPYKLASQSARNLRNGLSSKLNRRVLLIKPDGRFRAKQRDIVINWGSSIQPIWNWNNSNLNTPNSIKNASNKLISFSKFLEAEVSIPKWTINQDEAQNWLNNGSTIVVRHLLNGHSGQGIEIIQEGEIPPAPLYVEYKKKIAEFRVHVFKGEVIDTCQKRKSREANNTNSVDTFIRSYNNGWVFCRNNIESDLRRDETAIKAIQALELDFGAVDIIYNRHDNQYYVLEVNTAPGLEGTTLEKYVGVLTQL